MRMSEGFPLFSLTFDEEGALQSQDELDALIERAKASARGDRRHCSCSRLSK